MQSSPEAIKIKLVAVGDYTSERPRVLFALSNQSNQNYVSVFDNHAVSFHLDGNQIDLALWDTAAAEEYIRLRPLAYVKADVFIITFSLDEEGSWLNVTKRWLPELRQNVAKVPIIIVGTNSQIRKQLGSTVRPFSFFASEASKLDCLYIQCSWRTCESISQLRNLSVRQVMKHRQSQRPKKKTSAFCKLI